MLDGNAENVDNINDHIANITDDITDVNVIFSTIENQGTIVFENANTDENSVQNDAFFFENNTSSHFEQSEMDDSDTAENILSRLKRDNVNRLVLAHLNINSIRNKFDALKHIIKENIDILFISESKIDDSFPENQFTLNGFNHFRYDRDSSGGGGVMFIREDIPCREIKLQVPKNFEGYFFEVKLRKQKWLLCVGYNPNKNGISNFLNILGKSLDRHLSTYENLIFMGDFNSETSETSMKEFCETYNLKHLVKQPTCYKNAMNPTCIDLILTNKPNSFQHTKTIETGLSDFHLMTVTVLKTFFPKKYPTWIKYRNYNLFNEALFREEIQNTFMEINSEDIDYDTLHKNVMNILQTHAPIKEKLVRANNAPFMNKKLSKAIMTRTRLKNKYKRNPTKVNETNFKKQRNYCVKLSRQSKKDYFNKLEISKVTDNKTFWGSVKPLFSDKQKVQKKFILIEDNEIISSDTDVAEKMNDFFINAVTNLNIEDHFLENNCVNDTKTAVEAAIEKFKNHPSILKIKEFYQIQEIFSFNKTSTNEIEFEITRLNTRKTTGYDDIPAKILASCGDIVSPFIAKIYENSKINGKFPEHLKTGNVTPVHKKGDKSTKENYRPISILPTISKLFERNIYDQIYDFIEKYLSPSLGGFRKKYNTQNCLAVMVEKWKKAIDIKEFAGGVLTDLSKAFDCLNHDLLIAKLSAYGFDENSLNLIQSYLFERKQRTRVNNSYSQEGTLYTGVPQGSILGPLLFNIYINDIFLFTPDIDITNYADDTTPHSSAKTIDGLITLLEENTNELVNWFQNNYMKSNEDKNHLIITNCDKGSAKIGNHTIECSQSVKLLGVQIDNKLNFNEHISKICKNVSKKLHALARISPFMSTKKLRILMKAFIESQFGYCPLIWMFHSRNINNRINHLHERALRIAYKDFNSSFQELLEKDNSVTIHHRNLQKLATEMYKVKNGISPKMMQSVFNEAPITYNLRNNRIWSTHNIRTVNYGTETLSFRGPKTWELLPDSIKGAKSLNEFKAKVKTWKPIGCTCRLCKTYITSLGFL